MHQFTSFEQPTNEDIDVLMKDSILNREKIQNILTLLSSDCIKDYAMIQVTASNTWSYAGSRTHSYLKDYYISSTWQYDNLFDLSNVLNFNETEYNEKVESINISNFRTHKKDLLSLTIDNRYRSYKERFIFDIDEQYYLQMSLNSKVMLFYRLRVIISLIRSEITLNTKIKYPEKYIAELQLSTPSQHDYDSQLKSILKEYKLTVTNFEYFRYIAFGYSSKEIAAELFVSHRSVESTIKRLCDKYNVSSKEKLVHVARYLMSNISSFNNKL
ncbi:helix-turn-helix transcriptional regulator [Francisellaceae bacterium]|nr:helix-turn-helix transcriptional regulator [Francisellaceae bacterium]